jgi:hypothetical protein
MSASDKPGALIARDRPRPAELAGDRERWRDARTGRHPAAKLHLAKRAIIGRPLVRGGVEATLLPKRLALPIFSSDALSSVAYATEAALVVLVGASPAGGDLLVPISFAIAALLVLVVVSYRQTVRAYPRGGGSYVVASENLGRVPGLVAGASLLVDYVLTVAVSIAAGVLAITSAAPALSGARVELSLAFLVVLAVANARGVREASRLFALPTYGFVVAMGAMIALGLGKCALGDCPKATVPDPAAVGTATTASTAVALRAFASGCSALTGVEAIANGTRAFQRPQARNAAATLAILGGIAVVLFLGVSVLASASGARPSNEVSVLSELARAVFPKGSPEAAGFLTVQAFTFAILVLAANTAFQGFPRLTGILAQDASCRVRLRTSAIGSSIRTGSRSWRWSPACCSSPSRPVRTLCSTSTCWESSRHSPSRRPECCATGIDPASRAGGEAWPSMASARRALVWLRSWCWPRSSARALGWS